MIDSAADNNGNNNSASVNKIGKSGKKQYNEVIHCQPRKIFPLGNERNEDMIYPNVIYHYSVSTDARYVYVIGEDSRESQSQLFVWDLHRGSACRYAVVDLPWPLQIKHLYEIDYFEGILVCCSPTAFHIHAVRIDHSKHIIQLERILFYELNINSHFWSSARATERGIILMSQHSQIGHFYVAHIGLDTPVRSVFLKTRMYGLRFCGQPWVDGNYVYLFESSSITTYTEIKYLTGRLVRANLHTGELEIVRTEAADNIRNSLPAIYHQQQQQEQQQQQLEEELPQDYMRGITTLIRRMKHVGRDGWLWIIAEFVEPYDPLNQNAARCEICVVEMKTFTWYRLNWLPECKFDELTLDVASDGTVVLLRKKILQMANQAQIDSFILLSRNPETLLNQSFHALITHFPKWRNLSRQQMHALGIPTYLLIP